MVGILAGGAATKLRTLSVMRQIYSYEGYYRSTDSSSSLTVKDITAHASLLYVNSCVSPTWTGHEEDYLRQTSHRWSDRRIRLCRIEINGRRELVFQEVERKV